MARNAATAVIVGREISYDSMGRVVHLGTCTPSTCGWGGFDYFYTHDQIGDLLTIQDMPSEVETTVYNRAGRAVTMSGSALGALVSGVTYNASGQELAAVLGNGLLETRAYDGCGRPTLLQAGTAYHFSLDSYAPDGDVLGSSDSANGSWDYTYNGLGQLVQACTPNCASTVLNYGYDRYGNRWSSPVNTAAFTAANNRLEGASYDAAGNLLNDGAHTYQYDAENRLIAVDGGATAAYVYGPGGQRVWANVGGVVKEYVEGLGGDLNVFDNAQHRLREDVPEGGRTLATATANGLFFDHADWLGTVRVRSNASGAPAEAYTSWPFGAQLNQIGALSPVHFTGKPRDGESNLDYFGARYYSSQLGRFLTPDDGADPILGVPVPYASLEDPQSLNLRSYVGNNPVSGTDPDGHDYVICPTGRQCVVLSDEQYQAVLEGYDPGVNLPNFGTSGTITCGGSICGTAQYLDQGVAQDESGN